MVFSRFLTTEYPEARRGVRLSASLRPVLLVFLLSPSLDVSATAQSGTGGARAGALVAAQRAGHRPGRHAHRRDRHHL